MEQAGDLVVRAATGATLDERVEAYGRLVERFRDMACGYAYSILGDFHLAEDMAQEAFIVAFGKIGQLQQPEAFPGWFRRIVWSVCNRVARRKTLPTIGLDAAVEIASPGAMPHAAAEQKEMRDEVLKSIRGLPDPEREVTALFYINGYSQKDIADFLEVPVGTVKNRLSASRGRLKERMLNMVKDTMSQNAPGERFNKTVIDELLSRPRPLEIPNHPVREVWEAIRGALADYEVVDPGSEIEDQALARQAEDHAWDDFAFRLGNKGLRFQMITVSMSAVIGRKPPVRILAAGRVFRPIREATHRTKVFHQLDGVCIEHGADANAFKVTCERAIRAAVPDCAITWLDHDTGFVVPGFEAVVCRGALELEVLGGGMLLGKTLLNKGFDPTKVSGYSWGLSLERLAMLRLGIKDIHALWQPPYVS